MIIWHPCTHKEFVDLQEEYLSGGMDFRIINYQHLGDEEEPMELFEWGDAVACIPVLRSTLPVNRELYWRAE